MLMVLYDRDADAAFAVLRWRSQELNVKLNNVAAKLVRIFLNGLELNQRAEKLPTTT
jgi:hypothetical protein